MKEKIVDLRRLMKNLIKKYRILSLLMAAFFMASPAVVSLFANVAVEQNQNTSQDEQSDASISQLNLDVVFPSHLFDFSAEVFLLPQFHTTFQAVCKGFVVTSKTVFLLSYFEQLFEHHIAINAP